MSRKGGSYVDNASNRSLGRVGMAYGSCVQSSSSSSRASYGGSPSSSSYSSTSAASQKTYVDNASNRRLDRVGKAHGTHVVHADGSTSVSSSSACASSTASSSQKTYVDNPLNRSLHRVGEPLGSHVASTSRSAVYTDNPVNRKLGRALKPKGSHVISSAGANPSSTGSTTIRRYVDNYLNRKLNRVGQVIPTHRKKHTGKQSELEQKLLFENTLIEIREIFLKMKLADPYRPAVANVQYDLQRSEVEESWEKSGILPSTNRSLVSEFVKEIIPKDDITLQKQIGEGGFGKVYAALWKTTPVAFKKLICQQISNRKKKQLVNEIHIFSKLVNPNIVKMFGVVTEEENIGIVMEYLPKTLFRAIFIEEIEFDCTQKQKLLNEIFSAVKYLHLSDIAHCDIKCQNILLDANNVAKLCDFGLSAIKNSSTSTSSVSAAPGQGTPRYSAPEVLRGEILQLPELKMGDIYSLSLVIYQVLVEEEPFEDLTLHQLVENVGRGNLRPSFENTDIRVTVSVKQLLEKGWTKEALRRPDIQGFFKEWSKIEHIFS